MSERDCKHGQLARSCEICGLEADLESQAEYVKELQARLAWLQKTLTGRQRRHYASALRQLRNFRDGLREARALYAEKSGKPDRFDDPSAWWQNPRDKCVVLWLLEWAEDVQADLIEQLGKERDVLAAEVERLRGALKKLIPYNDAMGCGGGDCPDYDTCDDECPPCVMAVDEAKATALEVVEALRAGMEDGTFVELDGESVVEIVREPVSNYTQGALL